MSYFRFLSVLPDICLHQLLIPKFTFELKFHRPILVFDIQIKLIDVLFDVIHPMKLRCFHPVFQLLVLYHHFFWLLFVLKQFFYFEFYLLMRVIWLVGFYLLHDWAGRKRIVFKPKVYHQWYLRFDRQYLCIVMFQPDHQPLTTLWTWQIHRDFDFLSINENNLSNLLFVQERRNSYGNLAYFLSSKWKRLQSLTDSYFALHSFLFYTQL